MLRGRVSPCPGKAGGRSGFKPSRRLALDGHRVLVVEPIVACQLNLSSPPAFSDLARSSSGPVKPFLRSWSQCRSPETPRQ
jgi:hypothetical protein